MDPNSNLNNSTNLGTPEEQIRYWKDMYEKSASEHDELKKQYNEFMQDSKELEAELDTLLKIEEQKCKDLTATVEKLKNEVEGWKERHESQTKNENKELNELSSELSIFKKECDNLKTYVRDLEQKNDDFERANRVLAISIEDIESRLNLALEKNVILESELDDKESVKAQLQRLRDEHRDLRSELNVRSLVIPDSNRSASPGTGSTVPNQPLVPSKEVPTVPSRPTRLSPLSIVNDLLRKVGALETKLSTYKKVETPPKRQKRNGEVIKT